MDSKLKKYGEIKEFILSLYPDIAGQESTGHLLSLMLLHNLHGKNLSEQEQRKVIDNLLKIEVKWTMVQKITDTV